MVINSSAETALSFLRSSPLALPLRAVDPHYSGNQSETESVQQLSLRDLGLRKSKIEPMFHRYESLLEDVSEEREFVRSGVCRGTCCERCCGSCASLLTSLVRQGKQSFESCCPRLFVWYDLYLVYLQD
jgi:hypothetical protein